MEKIKQAKWIRSANNYEHAGVIFGKAFPLKSAAASALLEISALGVYEARLNGERIGDFILAPGWTAYSKRLQVQAYDVTGLLKSQNNLEITLGKGWRALSRGQNGAPHLGYNDSALIASLHICYENGEEETIFTNNSWSVYESKLRYTNIYNGDVYDANFEPGLTLPAVEFEHSKDILIDQQGEKIAEIERICAKEIIHTPAGETVIDFGQNLTGYVEFKVTGKPFDECSVLHAEVLDRDGNFYTENLRSARQEIKIICSGKELCYKPSLSFQGFRYVKLVNWPQEVRLENFTAVVVHSEMKRTGYFECSDPMVNKLFENIIWGQRGNFLDVPTDCPQRDERLGWTGDAQVFCRAAALNFDVEKFFIKWLADLEADQLEDGSVPHVIPAAISGSGSAAWADAAVICPWQLYLAYANEDILRRQFSSMRKWISYMISKSENGLWIHGSHFGDWLGLDEPHGDTYRGTTDHKLIATAFFSYSLLLFIKAGKVLNEDVSEYEELRETVVHAFRKEYMNGGRLIHPTQTGCVLALYFDLTEDKQATTDQLVEIIESYGHLTTGFVGTPYLLHTLSENGRVRIAYDLLLRREYPSWLYPITKGATTIWEHWDGIREDGTFWSKDMNSYNHYAYGAVGDWLFSAVAGINIDENAPGYEHIIFRPLADERLDYANARLITRRGEVKAGWKREGGKLSYEFTVPCGCTATLELNGKTEKLKAGTHRF